VGRTGTLWAHEAAGVSPDIMTIAKPLAGGLPMGAILLTDAVAQAIVPGDHGSTFAGGPFVSTVAGAVFGFINRPDFLAGVRDNGAYLRQNLQSLAETQPGITAVRGAGLMWGLVTTVPAADVVRAAMAQDLLIIAAGPNVVGLLPPLVITRTEINILLEKLAAAFDAALS